jgi:DNA-binding response OmpR family regulator
MLVTVEPLTLLLVDDDPMARSFALTALSRLGLSVQAVPSGDEALSVWDRVHPDLALLDVHMPGIDGLTLTRRIKERWPHCPVVLMTGMSDEETAITAVKAGAYDFLKKPFNFEELSHVMNRAVAHVRLEHETRLKALPIERLTMTLAVDNVPEQVMAVLNFLLKDVSWYLGSRQLFHIRMALQELLLNAIEHGNLGISGIEKEAAIDHEQYDLLVEQRRQEERYRHRRVQIDWRLDLVAGQIQFRIVDEGEGFDWRRYLSDQIEREEQPVGSGRGIFLVKNAVADFSYNEQGNAVSITVPFAEG